VHIQREARLWLRQLFWTEEPIRERMVPERQKHVEAFARQVRQDCMWARPGILELTDRG
jgi:hypothetical protein